MADEATVLLSLAFVKSGIDVSLSKGDKVTVSGGDCIHQTQTIGTSAEALDLGDITVPGYILICNKDATNYVEIRAGDAGADVVRLNAGELACFRFAADAVPYAIANSSSCIVEYLLIEA